MLLGITQEKSAPIGNPSVKNTRFPWWLLLLAGVVAALLYMQYDDQVLPPGVTQTPDGDLELTPERQAKLDRELEEINNAVQYVLVADKSGYFPCYSCPSGQFTVYLNEAEVWKYGVTRKGEDARYNGNYGAPDLLFVVEFEGDCAECLKMEKAKIYNYPFLPENLARLIVLIHPPGNKYDS